MYKETRQMGAYKGKRAHNQEGSLEDKESKKSCVVLRQTKRERVPSRIQVVPLGRTCVALRRIKFNGQSWP
jgi:hypothetical protein